MNLNATKFALTRNPFIGRLYMGWRYGWQSCSIFPFISIGGWLSLPEAIALFRAGQSVATHPEPVIVEIGSWLGKSSVVLAKSVASQPGAKVYCIDPFSGAADARSEAQYKSILGASTKGLFEQFQENISRAKINHLIETRQGLSTDFSSTWTKPIDLLFIDGNHDYEAVLRDFLEWTPHLKSGGIVAFHDVSFGADGSPQGEHPGPGRVVKERILKNAGWTNCRCVESLFIAEKNAAR